jgi:hypothetical protein
MMVMLPACGGIPAAYVTRSSFLYLEKVGQGHWRHLRASSVARAGGVGVPVVPGVRIGEPVCGAAAGHLQRGRSASIAWTARIGNSAAITVGTCGLTSGDERRSAAIRAATATCALSRPPSTPRLDRR